MKSSEERREKKQHLNLIKSLSKTKKQHLPHIIEHLSDNSIDKLCECLYNVIYSDLKLSKGKKNQIKKCLKNECSITRLKKITNKKVPLSKRRLALSMEGRGLGLLLSAAIPFLTNLIFGKKNE
jgi:hypothetical protein